MQGDVNKLFVFKILLTIPSNVLPLHLKQTFLPIIFTEDEGDRIEYRLPLKIFSALQNECHLLLLPTKRIFLLVHLFVYLLDHSTVYIRGIYYVYEISMITTMNECMVCDVNLIGLFG